jgi:MYXO-CTERM domain-containing protein
MRHVAALAFAFALTLIASIAGADVTIVADPSPPFSSTLVLGNFAETNTTGNERYQFTGQASNTATTSLRLLVRARGNGAAISASQETLTLAPGAVTPFNYDFTWVGHSPSSVGIEFEGPDGTIQFIAGTFHASAVTAPPAPATTPWALGALAAGLLLMGARRASSGRVQAARGTRAG